MNATETGRWAGRALDSVLERVAVTGAAVGDRFPLHAEPADGTWTTTRNGSWTGGFWAGLLWLRARSTGAAVDRRAASACTARLARWAEADTATRGLILWYGTAAAEDDPYAAALRARAARACLADFDPALGIVPWGDAFGGPRLLARADGAPGLVPLLAAAGPTGAAAASTHLHQHLDLCLDPCPDLCPDPCLGRDDAAKPVRRPGRRAGALLDSPTGADTEPSGGPPPDAYAGPLSGSPSCARGAGAYPARAPHNPPSPPRPPAWSFHGAATGWRPCAEPEPGWSRGDAWLLLAVADALLTPAVAGHRPARLVAAADTLAAPTLRSGPLVPPARTGHPHGPLDTSAAAITAVALLKLARLPGPGADQYAHRAAAILGHLVREHVTGPGPGRPAGMLLNGCYDAGRALAVRHELVWGDFFLALGLAALTGLVDPTRL
ncbi:sugar ABC transporter permease [Streptomyces sp. NPDC048383]|uniref:sugar ABC transporter permease n=1 Tax=Streptomyces sp. NPDC048383 TaxID=3155386 RepID=UPI00341D2A20